MIKEKPKTNKFISTRFSFLFFFQFCRGRKRKKRNVIANSDTDSIEEDSFPYDITEVKSKSNTAIASNKHTKMFNPDNEDISQRSKEPSSKPFSEFPRNSESSVNIKAKSPKKFPSPLKKRITFSTPSKSAPINSHVVVELSYGDDVNKSREPIQSCNVSEDKRFLLENYESFEKDPFDFRPTFESFGKEISQNVRKNNSSYRHICSPGDVKKQDVYPLTKKKHSSSNLKLLPPLSLSPSSKLIKDHRWNSFGNVNSDVDSRPLLKTTQLSQRRYERKKSELLSEAKSKSLANIHSKQFNKDSTSVSKKISQTFQMSQDSTRKLRNHHELPKNYLKEQIMKLTSTDSDVSPSRRSRSCIYQRSRSTTGLDESDYVMLNPISNVPRNEQSILSLYGSRKEDLPAGTLTPAKSFDSLHSHSRNLFSSNNTNSSYLVSPEYSENQVELFKSPGIDYRSKVEKVLAELRKSIRKEEDIVKNWTNFSLNHSFLNPEFSMKKSKSVEPITAQTRSAGEVAVAEINRSVGGTNRSRSRVRYIAKKYNMYTSNENVSAFNRNPYLEQQAQARNSFPEQDDYVYLNQLPTPLSSTIFQPRCADMLQSTPSSYKLYSPTNKDLLNSGTHLSSRHTDGEVHMTSKTGDFYHLDLFVENTRSVPDGAESHFEVESQSNNNNNNNNNSFSMEALNRPHVYYSLDV